MGPSTASMLRELQCNLPLRYGHTPRYPMWMAKRILKHALLRLSCLHDNGMAHGDVQPGNLLFTISDLTSLGEETLQQDAEQSQAASKQVKRLDGMPDRWAPRYLAESQSLSKYAELEPGLTVKGSDTGTVFQLSNPPKTTVTPAGLRALELILETNFNESVDIWSSGCLVFEFVIGIPLFTVSHWSGSEQDQTDDDHLLRMSDIFGPLPEELFSKWTRADRYFGPDRERINSIVDGSTSEDPPSLFDSLENRFDKSKPADMGEEDAASAISLIRTILQYVPSQRPSVNDLLRHPWLMEQ